MEQKTDNSHLTKSQREEAEKKRQQELTDIRRIKLPRGREVLGVLDQRLGGSRCRVRCFDGKVRVCRIPGRLKRFLWVREGNIVLVEPWEFSGDGKGDIVFKYKPNQVGVLRNKGLLKKIEEIEEFEEF
ncbi:translation initiation factor eIF-1A [Candidatus Woesearchaeota archaeon]|nr:translation initiation factor eIF-1A [Candidatus Woesearchaeota archaeon]